MPTDKPSKLSPPEVGGGDPSDEVERQVGASVSALRTARAMTQEQLAAAAGVTKGYISKIENGHIVPPIGTLVKIAHALQAQVSDFLKMPADAEDDAVCVVRADERQPVMRGASAFGYDYVSLAHKKRRKRMQPFLFTFPSAVEKDVRFEHEGEEFLLVLSGRVEFEFVVDGEPRRHVLAAGDSVYFESRIPHRGHGLGGEAKALVVIYTPEES
jgi:transcriptional regulator with XRE-family HTH domain